MIPCDLKEFEKFLKICRRRGVIEVATFQGVSIKFGDLPIGKEADESEEVQPEPMTEDQMMFYHLTGGNT